jgi:hypothetical protein
MKVLSELHLLIVCRILDLAFPYDSTSSPPSTHHGTGSAASATASASDSLVQQLQALAARQSETEKALATLIGMLQGSTVSASSSPSTPARVLPHSADKRVSFSDHADIDLVDSSSESSNPDDGLRHDFELQNRARLDEALRSSTLLSGEPPLDAEYDFRMLPTPSVSRPTTVSYKMDRDLFTELQALRTTFYPFEGYALQVNMASICSMIYSTSGGHGKSAAARGLILLDILGVFHSVYRKRDKPETGMQTHEATIYNPNREPTLLALGPSYTSIYIFPVSAAHFAAFIRAEVRKAVQDPKIPYEDAKTVQERLFILQQYEKLMGNLIAAQLGSNPQSDRYHVSKWALLLVFHVNRWVKATVSFQLRLLTDKFHDGWTTHYRDLAGSEAHLKSIFPMALTLLGYRCSVGHLGGCKVVCDACSSTSKDSTSPAYATLKKSYDKAYSSWRQTLRAADKKLPSEDTSHEAYARTAGAVPRPNPSDFKAASTVDSFSAAQDRVPLPPVLNEHFY